MKNKFSNPWHTRASRVIYDNPWIIVREDSVIRPDGQPGIYGVVQMKNTAVGVLPIDADGFTYLVGQFRYTLNCYSWEIPEGGCPPGEEPIEAARRELREETGLEAAQWQVLGTTHTSNSVTNEVALIFLATDLIPGKAEPEGTEQLELMRVPFEQAVQMVMDGEITDAISMVAILNYARVKAQNDHAGKGAGAAPAKIIER